MADATDRFPPLRLHEALLLLALNDEKGTASSGTSYTYALGGAIISELLLAGRIALVKPRRTTLVEVKDATPVGDALLDECLQKMAHAKRPRSVGTWVSKFAGTAKLKHRIADGLCDRGILRREEGKVLLVFNRRTYPTANPAPEAALVERMRQAVVDGVVPDPHTLVVISIAHGTGLLAQTLGKKVVRARKDWIKQLVQGDAVGAATKEAVQAAQAAMMVATMAASSAAITSR